MAGTVRIQAKIPRIAAPARKPQTCSGFRPIWSMMNHDIRIDGGITKISSVSIW